MLSNNASLQCNFSEEDKKALNDILSRYLKDANLYSTPMVEHIKGNVVQSLHMTLYYGNDINAKHGYDAYLNNFKEFRISNLMLRSGYKSQYYVLLLNIHSTDSLLLARKVLLKAAGISSDDYEFDAHVTLAYLKKPLKNLEIVKKAVLSELKGLKVDSITVEC